MTLSYDNRHLDRAVTGWRVKVARVMLNGCPAAATTPPTKAGTGRTTAGAGQDSGTRPLTLQVFSSD